MSWGTKITFLYAGFVGLILTMVGLTMRERVDLVSEDYYQQELEYQEKINTIERTAGLETPLHWELRDGTLVLTFPAQFRDRAVRADVCLFRPSDARLDYTVALPARRDSIRAVPLKKLSKGLYQLRIDWFVDDTAYYSEGFIQLQP